MNIDEWVEKNVPLKYRDEGLALLCNETSVIDLVKSAWSAGAQSRNPKVIELLAQIQGLQLALSDKITITQTINQYNAPKPWWRFW